MKSTTTYMKKIGLNNNPCAVHPGTILDKHRLLRRKDFGLGPQICQVNVRHFALEPIDSFLASRR
jgi:hypothetical protein